MIELLFTVCLAVIFPGCASYGDYKKYDAAQGDNCAGGINDFGLEES
jgi:hypothetical protein